jgi:hypothetical protein
MPLAGITCVPQLVDSCLAGRRTTLSWPGGTALRSAAIGKIPFVGAKKRQTMGKIMRERERAEKRALKKEKKDEKKIAAAAEREAAALGYPIARYEETDEEETSVPGLTDEVPPVIVERADDRAAS